MVLDEKKLYYIGFYEFGIPFTGSIGGIYGMHYRIARNPLENVHWTKKEERGEAVLEAAHWPGPMNYEHTDSSLIVQKDFEYSEDGKKEIAKWLSKEYESLYQKDTSDSIKR